MQHVQREREKRRVRFNARQGLLGCCSWPCCTVTWAEVGTPVVGHRDQLSAGSRQGRRPNVKASTLLFPDCWAMKHYLFLCAKRFASMLSPCCTGCASAMQREYYIVTVYLFVQVLFWAGVRISININPTQMMDNAPTKVDPEPLTLWGCECEDVRRQFSTALKNI